MCKRSASASGWGRERPSALEETPSDLGRWPTTALVANSGSWAGRGRQRSEGRAWQGSQAVQVQLKFPFGQGSSPTAGLGHQGGCLGGSVWVPRLEVEDALGGRADGRH